MSTFRRRPWAPLGRSQREGNSEDLFKEQIIVKEKTWLWMSSLFESHQLSEMFFTSEKRPRVQGLQLKLVPSYTIAEAHTHSHRCKCTCSHTFLKTPNSFSSSLSTNLRNYSPIRMIKTPSTLHTHKARTHTLIMSALQSVCASVCVCVLASFPLSRRWGNDTDVVFWSHSAALQLHLRRLAELLLLYRCRRRGETSTARSVVSVSMWGGGRREGASERGWKQKRRGRERLWSRGPPGRPSSASPPTRWIQRTTSRVGSFFLISNASPVCEGVCVWETLAQWERLTESRSRGWSLRGSGHRSARLGRPISCRCSLTDVPRDQWWRIHRFHVVRDPDAFWLLLFLNRSSQSPQQLQTVCVRARMHVCVCRICACTNVSARFSYCCVMYKWVWVAFKELLRCMNILKCSNIQKTLEREGKSWVTPWNTKVVLYYSQKFGNYFHSSQKAAINLSDGFSQGVENPSARPTSPTFRNGGGARWSWSWLAQLCFYAGDTKQARSERNLSIPREVLGISCCSLVPAVRTFPGSYLLRVQLWPQWYLSGYLSGLCFEFYV